MRVEFIRKLQQNCNMRIIQCRMARSGLRWSLDELAQQSGVSRRTIARFEMGGRVNSQTVEALRMTLEAAGAQFIESNQAIGVVLKGLTSVPLDDRTTNGKTS